MAKCSVCFRHCELKEGQTGACGARTGQDSGTVPRWYGKVSSIALDPIEKKPLYHFHPGKMILSVGSLGCNLRCPFCQNHRIAQEEEDGFHAATEDFTPAEIAEMARNTRRSGNIGVAYTYNEPLVGYEFVRDTAKLIHDQGMLNVLVTNGTASHEILEEVILYTDAMNIDLKGFTDRYYSGVLGGSLQMTMDFIREAVKRCHVELTTLIVPGENDTEKEMLELSAWIAGLREVYGGKTGRDIPLHVSRFFPRFRMQDRGATDPGIVNSLVRKAKEHLRYVYPGNC